METIRGYPYYPPTIILFNNTRSTPYLSSENAASTDKVHGFFLPPRTAQEMYRAAAKPVSPPQRTTAHSS